MEKGHAEKVPKIPRNIEDLRASSFQELASVQSSSSKMSDETDFLVKKIIV